MVSSRHQAAEQGGEQGHVPVGEVPGVQRRRRVVEHAPRAPVHATEPGRVPRLELRGPVVVAAAAAAGRNQAQVIGDARHGHAGAAVAHHAVAERGPLVVRGDRATVQQRRRRGHRCRVRVQRAAHGHRGVPGDGYWYRYAAAERAEAELEHVLRPGDIAACLLRRHGRDARAPARAADDAAICAAAEGDDGYQEEDAEEGEERVVGGSSFGGHGRRRT